MCVFLAENVMIYGSGKIQIGPGAGISPKELDAGLFGGASRSLCWALPKSA